MTNSKRNDSNHYAQWLKTQPKRLSSSQINIRTAIIQKIVSVDISPQMSSTVKDNTLFHKYYELQDWLPKQDPDEILVVKNNIWNPVGKSDYRRLKPELILVDGHYEVESKNIWGESKTQVYAPVDKLSKHWEILRVLISRARYDRFPGRTLNFLVRDKVTKKYLGVISITSDMLDLSDRNKSIGADISKFTKEKHPFNITVNGQTIVPTQPFGSAFLGGKLLSLLCLSKDVMDAWKKTYGDTVVGVTTTSLYGDTGKDGKTQYDGLTPYWKKVGQSRGTAPIKMTDAVYKEVQEWVRLCHPEIYFQLAVKSTKDKKNRLQRFAYKELGLPVGTVSEHKRNVYYSRIYKNSDEYIQRHINSHYDLNIRPLQVEELIPAFDNSIESLTEHWKFGYAGDTTTTPDKLRKVYGDDIRRLTKGRIDKNFKNKLIPTSGPDVDWYEILGRIKNWDLVRKKFHNQLDCSEK